MSHFLRLNVLQMPQLTWTQRLLSIILRENVRNIRCSLCGHIKRPTDGYMPQLLASRRYCTSAELMLPKQKGSARKRWQQKQAGKTKKKDNATDQKLLQNTVSILSARVHQLSTGKPVQPVHQISSKNWTETLQYTAADVVVDPNGTKIRATKGKLPKHKSKSGKLRKKTSESVTRAATLRQDNDHGAVWRQNIDGDARWRDSVESFRLQLEKSNQMDKEVDSQFSFKVDTDLPDKQIFEAEMLPSEHSVISAFEKIPVPASSEDYSERIFFSDGGKNLLGQGNISCVNIPTTGQSVEDSPHDNFSVESAELDNSCQNVWPELDSQNAFESLWSLAHTHVTEPDIEEYRVQDLLKYTVPEAGPPRRQQKIKSSGIDQTVSSKIVTKTRKKKKKSLPKSAELEGERSQIADEVRQLLLKEGDTLDRHMVKSLSQYLEKLDKGEAEEEAWDADAVQNMGDIQRVVATFTQPCQAALTKLSHARALEAEEQRTMRLANQEIHAYVESCVMANMPHRAQMLLAGKRIRQRQRHGGTSSNPAVLDVGVFNTLLQAWARQGKLELIGKLFSQMKEMEVQPNLQSYAACLECLGRMKKFEHQVAKRVLEDIKVQSLDLGSLFSQCVLQPDQSTAILRAIREVEPDFTTDRPEIPEDYKCTLLNDTSLSDSHQGTAENPYHGVVSTKVLQAKSAQQMSIELGGHVEVASIEPPCSETDGTEKVKQLLEEWRKTLKTSFEKNVSLLEARTKGSVGVSILPYLKLFDCDVYVDFMLKEAQTIGQERQTYSPTPAVLQRMLGHQIHHRYKVQHQIDSKYTDKVSLLHSHYVEKYNTPTGPVNQLVTWQQLIHSHLPTGALQTACCEWPHNVVRAVGKFLYDIILVDLKVDANIFKDGNERSILPAFYTQINRQGEEEIKPHPVIGRLFMRDSAKKLVFASEDLPSLAPPVPWTSVNMGGTLLATTQLIRYPSRSGEHLSSLQDVESRQLYPVFDALNILSACPWTINTAILDILMELFNNKGNMDLCIPPPVSECAPVPKVPMELPPEERAQLQAERYKVKKERAEMYSLWCTELYRLSIANKYRDEVFWYPHNLDFRGRVYPCPPHFNHLGNDVSRSLMKFAKGKPLGPAGLDWLKIHIVNLMGTKKRLSNADRLAYANTMMPQILDSADRPMTGEKWWQEADEPWQALACCMEIAHATRSPDHTQYICHLPVHQDGSCNGLQHYAAMGRDQSGAESVNLYPFNAPKDVYSDVLELVEKERRKDAANGVPIAQLLDGFVERKVIKQTVMTSVYGVTLYGARLQILRRLEDNAQFPQQYAKAASAYLSEKTLQCLQQMFSAAKEIQDWFTVCADLISVMSSQPVQWVTPLGLPVLQPYFRHQRVPHPQRKSRFMHIQKPNKKKQMNAFPPNFVHSLDSTHMMLTAINCHRAGITFQSVHDCYWTHPCDVDTMNRICREQFVALHSQPILQQLADLMSTKFGYSDSDAAKDIPISQETKDFVSFVLSRVPKTGTFELKNVLKSTYFFS